MLSKSVRALGQSGVSRRSFSVLSRVFGSSNMPRVPLDEPLTDDVVVNNTSKVERQAPQVTTLDNGVRVVSADDSTVLSSVSVHVDFGSRDEHPVFQGATQVLERMSLKSTIPMTELATVRAVSNVGANLYSQGGRESLTYGAESMRDDAPFLLQILSNIINKHLYSSWELTDVLEAIKTEIKEQKPHMDSSEVLHRVAFGNETLGKSAFPSLESLESFNSSVLHDHVKAFFTADKVVVSATGVDHAWLVAAANEHFGNLEKMDKSVAQRAPAQYKGGIERLGATDESTDITELTLAFPSHGIDHKDIIPMCVLQSLMGGGSSFSAGGPGKGMYSRLYTEVLNKHYWAMSAQSFNMLYTDASLLGLNMIVPASNAGEATQTLCQQAVGMAGPIDAAALTRAKNQLKASVYTNMESLHLNVEDMARQVLSQGKVDSVADVCAKIDAVKAADVQRVAKDMLKQTPSVVVSGNGTHVPSFSDIRAQLKQ
eukprot:TRINITY_DN66013_c5_g1_i1.p2 TRINITY_DN66013_c5_g1~~TRINITY_DN66013_c5_g1_i1.p2  ORF type:complete len:486 (+),score=270.52 TRINITY_DN66013_c5_g1_i1:691-2148(+)